MKPDPFNNSALLERPDITFVSGSSGFSSASDLAGKDVENLKRPKIMWNADTKMSKTLLQCQEQD